jgi:glutamate-5-semialdehyde dehydrogenase
MQVESLINSAVEAQRSLTSLRASSIAEILNTIACELLESAATIIEANAQDLLKMPEDDPRYDRLLLNPGRISSMAGAIRSVALLPSPVGRIPSVERRPNGMKIRKITVPFGVIGVIYESRPNVTTDVFSLCLRSCNACILKGGTDAHNTNTALVTLIREVLADYAINPNACILLPPDREAAATLLKATRQVDLIIPRGSSSLINFVRTNSLIPVIETGAGICHTYFDRSGNREIARSIVHNAKTRRVSVCNALDCLIIHRSRLFDLHYICAPLADHRVIIYADPDAYKSLEIYYPTELLRQADADSYGTEFLDYKMSVRTVSDVQEAMAHIAEYGSRHSECIIAQSKNVIRLFQKNVDAACVYSNASISFTDGGQFGMGSEIGISTQKLHARGPMGLDELVTYKYIISGDGQIRQP